MTNPRTSECSTSFRLLRGSVISAKATNTGSGKRTVTGTLKRAKRQWRAVFGSTSTTATRTSAVTAG